MSKEPILEVTGDVIKKFKASNVANPTDKIFVNITIKRFTRLLVLSGLFSNKSMRHNIDFYKTNFNTNTQYYKLDDATYIGTVGSTITDVSMDIYYVTEPVLENGVSVNIGYFIAFPTLLLIPKVGTISTRLFELQATIFGIDDDRPIMRSSTIEIPDNNYVKAYLKNVNITTPNKLSTKLITLPGLDEDSLYNTTEVYTASGQNNGDGIQPNQYIELGDITTLITGFNSTTGIDMHISTIRQTTHNAYAYGESERVNIKSGTLCIPLNF